MDGQKERQTHGCVDVTMLKGAHVCQQGLKWTFPSIFVLLKTTLNVTKISYQLLKLKNSELNSIKILVNHCGDKYTC